MKGKPFSFLLLSSIKNVMFKNTRPKKQHAEAHTWHANTRSTKTIQHTTNTHNSCFDPFTLSFQELLNSYVSLPSCLVSSASSAINIFGLSTMVAVSSISKTGHHPDIFDHTITLQEQYFAKFTIELACNNNLQKIDPDW